MVFVVFHCVSASYGHRCTAGVDWDHQVASWPRRCVVRAPAHAVLLLDVSWCGHVGVMWTAKGESDNVLDLPQDLNPLVQINLSQRMLATTPEWSRTKTRVLIRMFMGIGSWRNTSTASTKCQQYARTTAPSPLAEPTQHCKH